MFQAFRRMDEILVSNFMVFHDVVREQPYDLWIGDEAWELDYFLHENPELKTAPYVWLTDFVGWLPMPDGGEREAALTADYNAEMIEQIARYPRVRDRSIFVGEPDDIVPGTFGPGLPAIRDWTERHFSFTGYVTGLRPCHARRPRARCARSSATAPTSRSASSPSAARASASICCAGDRELPRGQAARPGAADDRRRRPADRSARRCPQPTGSRSGRTCTTSTATWPPATSRSSRAG